MFLSSTDGSSCLQAALSSLLQATVGACVAILLASPAAHACCVFVRVCVRFGCKVHCVEISEKENEDNARVTEEEKMQDLIAIHPESFCETSLPNNSVDAV